MKIGDMIKVKDCGLNSYHSNEIGIIGFIIEINKDKDFPIKIDTGNCYLEKCLEIIK